MKQKETKRGADVQPDKGQPRAIYKKSLAKAGLSGSPVPVERKSPRQFQMAMIAATLGKHADDSATKLAARALDIWDACGTSILVESQTRLLVKGVLVLDQCDWETHGKALIRMLDTSDGGVPGQKSPEKAREQHEDARVSAARAVYQLWRQGPENEDVLQTLFSGRVTIKTYTAKFPDLLRHAKNEIENSDRLLIGAKSPDRVSEAIRTAWMPLGVWNQGLFEKAVNQVKALLRSPVSTIALSRLAINPLVARLLAVMRADELSSAKKRPKK